MTNYLSFQIHGNAGHSGSSPAESVENILIFITNLIGKQPLEIVATLLPGVTALQNIHPMLVHFPIAFLIGFFVLDVVGAFAYKPQWRSGASCFLYLGTLSAAATVCAGLLAASSIAHGGNVHDIMERHEDIGFIVLGLSCLLSVWRMNVKSLVCDMANSVFMMLSTALCVMVLLGADLGGLMVYKYGVAVNGVQQESHDHTGAEELSHEDASVEHNDEVVHSHSEHAHSDSSAH